MLIFLLQISTNGTPMIFFVVLLIVVIIVQALYLRWVFKINEQIGNQQAIIWLLINLCLKSGVDPEQIEEIKTHFSIK